MEFVYYIAGSTDHGQLVPMLRGIDSQRLALSLTLLIMLLKNWFLNFFAFRNVILDYLSGDAQTSRDEGKWRSDTIGKPI